MALTTTPETLVELARLHARIAELERLSGIRAPGATHEAGLQPPAYAEGLHEIVAGFVDDMLIVCDIAGTVIHANHASERVLGYKPQELIGTNAWSYVHPEDLKATAAARSAPLDDGIPFENRGRAPDGSYRWLELVARRWPRENPTHVVIRFRRAAHREARAEPDAGGSSKLHVQLRYAASLARLSQLALGLPLASDVLDAATSLGASGLGLEVGAWLEPSARETLRLRAETGLSAAGAELAVPVAGSLAGLAWTRNGPVDETQLPREARSVDPLLAAAGAVCGLAVPVRGVERVHGVLVLAGRTGRSFEPEDVHFAETVANVVGTALDSRAAQEALGRRERLTRAVFDHARDGLLIVDDEGRCIDANRAAHDALGVEPGALVGRRPSEVAATTLDLSHDGGTAVAFGEASVGSQAGTRTLEFERVPRIQPGIALAVLRDVTDRRDPRSRLAPG